MDNIGASLRFGKYKGVPLGQVPSNYIRWLMNSSKETVKDMEDELVRRGAV